MPENIIEMEEGFVLGIVFQLDEMKKRLDKLEAKEAAKYGKQFSN